MPEIKVTIGGRSYDVACQEGQEHFLQSAAQALDTEAQVLGNQLGRMPESRMLLMAGLMLADRTASVEEQLRAAEAQLGTAQEELAALRNAPRPEPERTEVPVIPGRVVESLAEMAARTEALAQEVEEKASGEQ